MPKDKSKDKAKGTTTTSNATLTRKTLIDLLNEDLSREYQGDHRLRQLLPGPQRRPVYEHRWRTRGSCEGRASPRTRSRQPYRLPRWHAFRHSETRQDLREGYRHAKLRPRQRERGPSANTAAASSSATSSMSSLSANRYARFSCRSRTTSSPWPPHSASTRPTLASPTDLASTGKPKRRHWTAL